MDEGLEVTKAVGALVTRVEQIAIREIPAPTIHVTVPPRGRVVKTVLRDAKGRTEKLIEEPEAHAPGPDDDDDA